MTMNAEQIAAAVRRHGRTTDIEVHCVPLVEWYEILTTSDSRVPDTHDRPIRDQMERVGWMFAAMKGGLFQTFTCPELVASYLTDVPEQVPEAYIQGMIFLDNLHIIYHDKALGERTRLAESGLYASNPKALTLLSEVQARIP